MHDRPASERRARVLFAWSIGSGAAIAQTWDGSARSWVACCALGVAGIATLWWLANPPIRLASWRTLLLASTVVSVAIGAFLADFLPAFGVTIVGVMLAFGALVRWPLLRSRPREGPPPGPLALTPLVTAMVMWFRDPQPLVFVALAILTVVLLQTASRHPRLVVAGERRVKRFAAGVAGAVTVVLASISMVVFVLPVTALSRLVGYSPLRNGWVSHRSAWVRIQTERGRTPDDSPVPPRRAHAPELPLAPSARRRARLRWAPLVGLLLVAGLATQFLGGGHEPAARAADRAVAAPTAGSSASDGDGSNGASSDDGGTFTSAFEDDPAFEDAPWAADLRMDLLDSWHNLEFTTSGWRLRDGESPYINVTAGERRTIAPDPALGTPLEVWFFGGSAAFGAGQRDEHTIPSELVRLADADGSPVQVRNFGVPATVNWQSMILLAEKLKWDPAPDLVVFYDGSNDLALQGVLASQGQGSSSRPASLFDAEFDAVLRERATPVDVDGATRAEDTDPGDAPTPAELGDIASTRYLRGVEMVRLLADSKGVATKFFWQPQLPTKDPLSGPDRETLRRINFDDAAIDWAIDMSDAARSSLLRGGIHDLTGVLDGRDEPLYWDAVHTNELGARLVAEAMYEVLELDLDRDPSP